MSNNFPKCPEVPKMPWKNKFGNFWDILGSVGHYWELLGTFGALLGPKVPKSAQKYQAEPIKTFMLAH